MVSVILGVIGSLLGLLIYYVRVMSVAIDVKDSIEKNVDLSNRYVTVYRISEKLEKIWPVIEPIDQSSWSKKISNTSMCLVLILLLSAGAFQEYLTDYAGFGLILLVVFSSLSNGESSVSSYEKVKPYVPIVLPAMTYQGLTMLVKDHPVLIETMTLPSFTFFQTKIFAAMLAFILAFIIPYPLAKFDEYFTKQLAKSTLFFTKDLLRLGVTPRNTDEAEYRKLAKESVAFSLKVILILFGMITFFTHTS